MTETRPILATVICIFEGAIVVLAVIGRFLLLYLRHSYRAAAASSGHAYPVLHVGTMQQFSTAVSCLLALAAAITLWQMRRSAFYLLATRTAISAAWFVIDLARSSSSASGHSARYMLIHWVSRGLSFASLALSFAIAWYVYKITLPKLRAQPLESPTPTPIPPTADESVSRFYISNIDNRKKPK